MSQKVQRYQNQSVGTKASGKFFVRAVYDKKFITTAELADFIQTQCTVKRSDCKAVLDELGSAFKHYFELGQKIRLDNIGIFKVGVTSAGSDTLDACTAGNVKKSRVIFSPETESAPTGKEVTVHRAKMIDGVAVQVDYKTTSYSHTPVMLKDVAFELTRETHSTIVDDLNPEPEEP